MIRLIKSNFSYIDFSISTASSEWYQSFFLLMPWRVVSRAPSAKHERGAAANVLHGTRRGETKLIKIIYCLGLNAFKEEMRFICACEPVVDGDNYGGARALCGFTSSNELQIIIFVSFTSRLSQCSRHEILPKNLNDSKDKFIMTTASSSSHLHFPLLNMNIWESWLLRGKIFP